MAENSKLKEFFTFKRKGETKKPQLMTTSTGEYEINLVPEVKIELLRMQKVRNLVLFAAIVVASASVGLLVILGGIKAGQDIALSSQDSRIEDLSMEINSDTQLSEVLTVQNQLNKIAEIEDNKKVLSRVFSLLTVLLPSEDDKIVLSELNVNFSDMTLNFEAQADAGVDPLIDYRVLESFKKSVGMMKYDYGRYVTANGSEILTVCMEETDADGKMYTDEKTGGIYAMWKMNRSECLPDGVEDLSKEKQKEYEKVLKKKQSENDKLKESEQKTEEKLEDEALNEVAKDLEDRKIWRTPQFKEWYDDKKMSLSGEIADVEHFESQCITYSGTEKSDGKGDEVAWSAENSCVLAENGITVLESANARDASDNLVLSFTAEMAVDPGFFAYNNKHVMGIGPFGQNVTDSYVQTKDIFVAPAKECSEEDMDCLNNKKNSTGE